MADDNIDFSKMEKKWQKKWEEKKVFEVKEDKKKKKYYVLEMFPYPSGSGLHMGHAWNYSIGDIFARFKIMQGFNVLHPAGYDSLGLPAENAAIKEGMHPEEYTNNSIKTFMKQQKALGLTYDWTRMVNTADPGYYMWDQWIFLKMFERGLVYQKESPVNWCPKCNTILANEQVVNGNCWRHEDTQVEIKQMNQWYLKITDYADRLLKGHEKLNWPEKTIAMQRNWIGKSHGTEIDFIIPNNNKVILVDAVYCLVDENGNVNKELKNYLDSFDNKKIVLTNAPLEKYKIYFNKLKDYEIFTLEHKPDKKSPEYYKKMLDRFNLKSEDVIYFEHDGEACMSAKSVGIKTLGYTGNIQEVKNFVSDNINEKWPIFTTRPDTIFGVTFMVVSAQHKRLNELVSKEQKKEVDKFLKKLKSVSEKELADMEKEGVFTGSYAINPATGKKVPVYAGNFVVADYGAGMVMAVPAHDQRDFEFAKKYKIEIKQVIEGNVTENRAYTDNGKLMGSGKFDGLNNEEAKLKIAEWLAGQKLARNKVNYKLRDWSVARQRYWGTPIPLIHCDKCGVVPVPEKDLPIKLPKEVKFGKGNPLETNDKWLNVKCPKCSGKGRREPNTLDTFVNSSWYFLRYCDPQNKKEIFSKEKAKYWMPVDLYIGGAEHACMHLIYCRFYTMFLHDIGLIDFDEPAPRLFHQGMLAGESGEKMSKSKGNVILPEKVSDVYGIDTARFFLCSLASPDKNISWDENGIQGSLRLIRKIYHITDNLKIGKDSEEVKQKLMRTIKAIGEQIEKLEYRKSTIELRELFDLISSQKEVSKETLQSAFKLLAPFCPHIAEEMWEKIGGKGFVSLAEWPKFDESKMDNKIQSIETNLDKNVSDILNVLRIVREKSGIDADNVYMYVMPFELANYNEEVLSKKVGKKVNVFAVNDKKKYDPEGKASKAKPGKPGIFVE